MTSSTNKKITKYHGVYKPLAVLYTLLTHMQAARREIGLEAYLRSPVRLQHVTGNVWFGINSLGDTDCVARQVRLVTDSLGQKFNNINNIDYRSESCLSITNASRNKTQHVVEHLREVASFRDEVERRFIIGDDAYTVADVAKFIILEQVVVLVEKTEQTQAFMTNYDRPFSKYSVPIYYRGQDVSGYTYQNLVETNNTRYADLIADIEAHDWLAALANEIGLISVVPGKHTMPTLEFIKKHHNDEMMLLHTYYYYKRKKVTDPASARYNRVQSDRYQAWLANIL